jgi:DNA repair exonuclease SbcCD ATPase subunit
MKLNGEKQKIREALLERQNKVGQLKGNISFIEIAMKQNTATMDSLKSEIDDLRGKVAEIKTKEFDADAWKFDETTTICSLCGQRLPDDRIAELKESFEQKKAEAEQDFNVKKNAEIKRLVDRGRDATEEYHKAKDNEENKAAELEKLSNELCQADKEAEDLQRQLEAMPGDVDLSDNAEYTALIDKANDLEKQITEARFSTKDTTEIQEKKDCAKNQLELTLAEIGKAQMNNDFDERISDLNAQKKQLEQEKADCEKILYQLSIVSQKKNTMLEESVNKHFKIVKWKLFDTQKNGTVIDSCIPLIDGYQFGTSTNTGREILAKLDIIEGLQNYFNQHYPVFLDGAEALSKVTADRIGIDGQIVMMIVSEDKELKFNERKEYESQNIR